MRDIFFMFAEGAVISRFFVMNAVLGKKSCWILVIYLTKFRKGNSWIFSIFSFVHKF